MKIGKKAIIITSVAVAVVVLFGVGMVVAAQRAPKDGIPKTAVTLEVQEAHLETIIVNVTASGKAEFIEKYTVYPSTSAKLDMFDLKVGDSVVAGDIIAIYDEDSYETLEKQLKDAELALKSAQISLENAGIPASETELLQAENTVRQVEKAKKDIDAQIDSQDFTLEQYNRNLVTAKDTYEKNKILFDNRIISKAELDNFADQVTKIEDQITTAEKTKINTLTSYASSNDSLTLAQKQLETLRTKSSEAKTVNQIELQKIQVEQAENSITKIKDQLDDYVREEKAKHSGTVISVGYSQGETANASKALVTIADITPKNLVIKSYIPENEAVQIEVGQEVSLTGTSIGSNEYFGMVSRISPTVETALIGTTQEPAVAIEVTLNDSETGVAIKSGNTLDLDITTKVLENVTVIPLMSTILDIDKNNYVYVMKEDYSVEKRLVTLLNYADLNVQVEGLTVGEQVVNNPPTTLKEGDFVRPGNPIKQVQLTMPGM